GYLHLGHLSGAYLPADIFARYSRLSGNSVLYICGSDEHGVAITISAEKEGKTPQEIIDQYHFANKNAFEKFKMSFDFYSRTSYPEHHKLAKEFFAFYLQHNYLVEKEEEQFYDEKAKMFLPDRYVEGTCPNCGYDKARGDQCDNCGAYYNQTELINPKSIITNETPSIKPTTHWYFKFQEFQDFLQNYIESHSDDWKQNVLQQCRSWLNQGLAERAITRDIDWGVKIDDIPGIDKEKAAGKVLYVWFDAVLGYISGTQIWARNYYGDENRYVDWWKNPETDYYAFIGKDNIIFHTLIFPAMLHARGDYILPKNVPANEFLNLEGQKFSKSRNWSIDLIDFLRDFPDDSSIDALRYTLLMNLPETHDSDFTWRDFQLRNNSELAAILGNFVNRTIQFVLNNFNQQTPNLSGKLADFPKEWTKAIEYLNTNFSNDIENAKLPNDFSNLFSQNDILLIQSLWYGIEKSKYFLSKFRIKDAFFEIMNIARASNKFFNDEAPWKTIKTDPDYAAKTLYSCVQMIYNLSILFAPVIPSSSMKMQQALNIKKIQIGNNTNGEILQNYWDLSKYPNIAEGNPLNKLNVLFPIIEDKIIAKQIEKLGISLNQQNNKKPEPSNLISIDEFRKIHLRTAKIINAEKIEGSDKLVKLQIEIGAERRQIVAGIAKYYEPNELIGKNIVVVANLQPTKLFGQTSEGMLLAAKTPDGKLSLISPIDTSFPSGADVS
ncbi:MAG TPA: methionine--tRNA ligase, partial [Candidatus Kapabacteria bacterium]|nr:methionine--tRNA ligase [Candidatus Kapabacteria bacterium]